MNKITIQSDYLWFLILSYTVVLVLANLFDARLVKLAGLVTDAGTLLFPFTFILSDLITEVYGYKYARRAIWYGFLFNVLFVVYGQLVIHLPGPNFETNNAVFNTLLTLNTRIAAASFLSYLVAAPVNAAILAILKVKMRGQYMGYRFVASTFASAGLDSVFFGCLAFYGMMPITSLGVFILTMWMIKIIIELVGLPLSIFLAKKLKQIEQLDVYDDHTRFTLFALDTVYVMENNRYS